MYLKYTYLIQYPQSKIVYLTQIYFYAVQTAVSFKNDIIIVSLISYRINVQVVIVTTK